VDPYVIHSVYVSALSVPPCCTPLIFSSTTGYSPCELRVHTRAARWYQIWRILRFGKVKCHPMLWSELGIPREPRWPFFTGSHIFKWRAVQDFYSYLVVMNSVVIKWPLSSDQLRRIPKWKNCSPCAQSSDSLEKSNEHLRKKPGFGKGKDEKWEEQVRER